MKKYWLSLFLILILAFALRVIALADFPVGLTPDEAAQGYTAYSILKTGRDEWSVSFPLFPRSFGDFKPPLYTYLTIPSIALFGFNEFAVRLPAAIFGALAVLVTFLMVKELSRFLHLRGVPPAGGPQSEVSLALLSSFFLAISPWHIQLSRGAFEASLLVFLIPLGIWFFLKGLEKSGWLVASAFSFGLSLFAYHSAKVFVPLLIIALFFWQKKKLMGLKKKSWSFIVIFAFFFLLLIWGSYRVGASIRGADVMILNPTGGWGAVADKQFAAVQAGWPYPLAKFFNNKATYVLECLINSYAQYFSPQFLFTNGPAEGFYGMLPGRGLLYLFELPLVLYGFWVIVRKKDSAGFLVLTALLLAPIPAALAKGPGYAANRAVTMLPFWPILSAYGGVMLWQSFNEKIRTPPRWAKALLGRWMEKKKFQKLVLLFFSFLIFLSFCFFLEDYFIQSPRVIAEPMRLGWRETMNYLEGVENDYQQIIVSRAFSEPQAYVMFYQENDPLVVQQGSVDWWRYQKEGLLFLDQLGEYSLGKYVFRRLNFPTDRELKKTLLVGQINDFPFGVPALKAINYPNHQPAFMIVDPERLSE